jgi:hypothetical protein
MVKPPRLQQLTEPMDFPGFVIANLSAFQGFNILPYVHSFNHPTPLQRLMKIASTSYIRKHQLHQKTGFQ